MEMVVVVQSVLPLRAFPAVPCASRVMEVGWEGPTMKAKGTVIRAVMVTEVGPPVVMVVGPPVVMVVVARCSVPVSRVVVWA